MMVWKKTSTVILFLLSFAFIASAQESRQFQPKWWFGGMGGVNFNYYSSTIRQPNASFTTPLPNAFTKGAGAGLFLAPLVEYRPHPVWGGMFTLGFDGRSGDFDDVNQSAGAATLSASMNYLSLEPSLRISPFPSDVFFFVGPRLAFNVGNSFEYLEQGQSKVEGDWSENRGTVVSAQFGAGYDFTLSGGGSATQVQLSPFVAVHAGQGPRSAESWSLTSVRLGAALKFGNMGGSEEILSDEVRFSIRAPKIIPSERQVRETFPMRNYVFFDQGSLSIPSRYELLTREQATSFREEQLLEPRPKDLTGRSRRQITVYHNIINVVGDRLRNSPNATITLSGASDKGAGEGKQLAESIKRYLVDVFGIDESKIRTAGRDKPEIPSVAPGATRELELVRAEDRRVDITSSDPLILRPIQIVSLQEDPLDSDVILTVAGAEQYLSSWSLEVTDENGQVKRLGPFTKDQERLTGRAILGDKMQGQYRVAMVGQTKGGGTVRKEESVRLVRSDEPDEDLGLRFSILFEFDQSKTVSTYERFLADVVAPLIPNNGSVIIHGHTDIIGEESHNLSLARSRAQETMNVIERVLSRQGKRAKFDTYGFGEDPRRAPFENNLPEERFYNRTVIIDILPAE